MDAIERINVLHDGGVISDDVKETVLKVLDWLTERKINVDSDNGQMFITHLAMSLERNRKGEDVEALSDTMMDEVRSSRGYGLASEFVEYLEAILDKKLPENEKGYILLHLSILKETEGYHD